MNRKILKYWQVEFSSVWKKITYYDQLDLFQEFKAGFNWGKNIFIMFYNNKLKDKTMIISVNAEKAFVKIKYSF